MPDTEFFPTVYDILGIDAHLIFEISCIALICTMGPDKFF